MKGIGKKLLSLLFAGVLLLGIFPAGAFAEDASPEISSGIQRGQDENGNFVSCVFDRGDADTPDSLPGSDTAATFGVSAYLRNEGKFYNQLNTRQKACYDAMNAVTIDRLLVAAREERDGKIYRKLTANVSGMTGIIMSGTVDGGQFRPDGKSKAVENQFYADLAAAVVSMRYDHPEILWMNDMSYGYQAERVPGSNTVKVTAVTLAYYLEYDENEKQMAEDMMGNARVIAQEAEKLPHTYQKVLAVHDVLAELNTYGDTAAPQSHTAYSALIPEDEYEPVCDGYSKAFKIIMDLLDIPCVLVSSDDHMWNNVLMDDGEWYNLDLTWDDENNSQLLYDYFLIGSDTLVEGEPFSQQKDHLEENPYAMSCRKNNTQYLPKVNIGYPVKSKEKYEYQGEEYPPLTFPDVRRSHWFFGAVEKTAGLGLFSGDPSGLFLPNKDITRAEFAMVMANAMGADLAAYKGKKAFDDVPADRWDAAAIAWAKENEVMSGYPGNVFNPGDPITRQEMCVTIANTLKPAGTPPVHKFTDDSQIGDWARDSVNLCYSLKIISGNPDGSFAPKANTKRCHAAVVFSTYVDLKL